MPLSCVTYFALCHKGLLLPQTRLKPSTLCRISHFASRFVTVSALQKRQYRDFLDIMCEQTDIAKMRIYWWVVCVFLIWVPTLILLTCFVVIFIKMRRLKVSNRKSGHHSEFGQCGSCNGQLTRK